MTLRLPPPPAFLQGKRWSLLAGIGCLTLLAVAAVQGLGWTLSGRPSLELKVILFALNLGLYLWARMVSGLQFRSQLLILAGIVVAEIGLSGLVRVDGFAGDGRPQFRWRWTPTPEQVLASAPTRDQSVAGTAELTNTTPWDSPEYRGPGRTGIIRCPPFESDWAEHPPRELWRRPVGRGWSSFAVVGDYAVTQQQRGELECVTCYHLRTGELVWEHRDQTGFDEITSGPGPRATPTILDGRVYSFGGTGLLNCLNGADGTVIWSCAIPGADKSALFGQCGSPLVHGERVYVTPGGVAGSLVAVDRLTGEILWKQGDHLPGYSSPVCLKHPAGDQILVFGGFGLESFAAGSGDPLWTFPWGDNSAEEVNVAQPVILNVIGNGDSESASPQLLISSGYSRGSALLDLEVDQSGGWVIRQRWHSQDLDSKFSDLIVHAGSVYGLDDGILTCLNLQNGERRWKQGRYGYGQLLRVNDWLLVLAESGRVALVELNPEHFREQASLDALPDRTWSHPVVAGGCLLVRNDREAACYELPSAAP